MKVKVSSEAIKDLEEMDKSVYEQFKKHLNRINGPLNGPLRHLRRGLPYFVDEVGQGRIVGEMNGDTLYVLRCFARHKDYEDWYRGQ
jgi:mRNA-degrading endonuclease RelE of RelBE toxin-antitoxin system